MSLAQATQMGDDFHLQWASLPPAPGTEGIEMPRYQQGHKQFLKQSPTGTQTICGMNGGGITLSTY
jgi:hypothetical protein